MKLVSIFNDDGENYFKIKVNNINNESYIKNLINILNELKISQYLDAEPEILSKKYKNWIGNHEFFRTKEYVIHIIFAEQHLHLIVNCTQQKRKEFIKILKKYVTF